MRRERANASMIGRVGNAGVIASFAIALAGVLIGATAAYIGKYGAAARATRSTAISVALREDLQFDRAWRARAAYVEQMVAGAAPERGPEPPAFAIAPSKPKIIIIFDDMGIDPEAARDVLRLPGPLTLSFLPYAADAEKFAERTLAQGWEALVHLPMEPDGAADPGPHALLSDMTGADFIKELEWNLSRIKGVVGVNNHMGSKLTSDEAAMKTVLAYLRREDLFFIDSVTTSDTVARAAGAMVGAQVFARDVFIDPDPGDRDEIRRQLALAERIATETGFAVAICHPRPATIEAIGPWLASAPFRGFDLVMASSLIDIEKRLSAQPLLADAPTLRL